MGKARACDYCRGFKTRNPAPPIAPPTAQPTAVHSHFHRRDPRSGRGTFTRQGDRAKAKAKGIERQQSRERAKKREQKKRQTRAKPQGGKEALQRLGAKQEDIPKVHDTFKGKAMKPSRRQQQQKILKVGMNALVG
jgi:hypothetical protein